jgi:hypothetical protein
MKSEYFPNSPGGRLVQCFGCVLMVGLLTGCAFTRTPVQVNLAPRVDQPLKVGQKASLEVGEVRDSRLVTDQFVLLQKANGYGPTDGAYITDKPVAEIFRNGLAATLRQNGFMTTNGTSYELRGNIQSFGFGVIQRAFSSPTAKSWLTVRFELVDKSTGLPIWHDAYDGQDTEPGPTGFDNGTFIATVFSKVSEDVIRQLVSDRAFRSYFER